MAQENPSKIVISFFVHIWGFEYTCFLPLYILDRRVSKLTHQTLLLQIDSSSGVYYLGRVQMTYELGWPPDSQPHGCLGHRIKLGYVLNYHLIKIKTYSTHWRNHTNILTCIAHRNMPNIGYKSSMSFLAIFQHNCVYGIIFLYSIQIISLQLTCEGWQ